MADYLLGIDIGTSSTKVGVFDSSGKLFASASNSYPTYREGPLRAEQDPRDWWQAAVRGIRSVLQSVEPREIAGIGIAGQSWAALPVDSQGRPLRRAMIWLDRRAETECEEIREKVGEEKVLRVSGNRIDPAFCIPKILWLKRNEPEVFRNAFKFLQSNSFIVKKLSGAFSQDISQGYGVYGFDMARAEWSGEILEELGLEPGLFPELFPPSAVVGEVTREASLETGLAEGTPVVAGGLDAACATLGGGVARPGETQEQGGQAGGMSICTDRPVVTPRLILGFHVIPGVWLLQGGTVGGGSLGWFLETFGQVGRIATGPGEGGFELLSREAARVSPGSGGLVFLPYMAGERSPIWDQDARGVLIGLSYDKTWAEVVRAIMEGCAYALRHNLEVAEEAGAWVLQLISVGGAAKSEVWCQIKADVTGKPVAVPDVEEGTIWGAALLAGMGVGIYGDIVTSIREMVHIKRVFHPREEISRVYDGFFEIYLSAYEGLKDTFRKLRESTKEAGAL
ncbi:MAG: FGGY-family carbohydrate kinase [Firmicutes bacterium]|nr:FGGY-family carbohydrate kinase [Bacillota bacterium]